MSKRNNTQEEIKREAERAELLALLAEQDAIHRAREEQDRQHTQQMLREFRQELARDRLEAEATSVATYREQVVAEATSSRTVAPQLLDFISGSSREEIDRGAALARAKTAEIAAELVGQMTTGQPAQPRDAQGRWLQQQPAAEPAPQEPAEVDYATMSMQEYAAARARLGIDRRGMNNLGRAPGRERHEFMGHRLEDGSGFADWRQYTTNERVYESQLGSRNTVPPGYVRSAESEDWK